MAIAYSQDLRERALNLIESGMPITDISRLLSISRPTLYKWQRHRETKCLLGKAQTFFTGSTSAKQPGPPTWLSKIKDWKKFIEFVEQHGDKTQEEMAKLWGNCTSHTISRGLKKIGYTRKKKR